MAFVVAVVVEDHRSLALRMLLENIFSQRKFISFRMLKERSVEGGGGGDDDDGCCCLLRIIGLLHFAFSLGFFSFMGSEGLSHFAFFLEVFVLK